MPLGQITLPVTFGTTANYRTEFIKFEVANFYSSYHAIFGCPDLAKFMDVPHYLYLLFKMPGPKGILSFRGDLKHSYDCDIEAVHAAKAQLDLEVQEIGSMTQKMKQDDLESPAKKTLSLSTTLDASTKKIVLDEADTSKTAVIGSQLSSE
ncbi:uncharacterized protein [Miscanthus floridulus]|uniref:uncharacterized protein n=1 Tax=Miscanthus floridulus TaxID=154761 RepID=UPI003457888F